ncbi:Hpt domain-containing protein, partial [Vibrio harveyi]|nr:Hpt domain-containing protein [Vibrio harveyi]
VQKLKLTSVNTNLILSQLHKMKGGCAQIGIDAITNLIDRVEYVVKTDSKNHSREVENLIKEIELSITSLIEWCDER